ncbi:MAG: hypothetical protein ACRYF4_12990 [Janthinobacterium lividum]
MPRCACGCSDVTKGGQFCPGHDQKLRAALERRLGGLLKLRDLVTVVEDHAAGKLTDAVLSARIRAFLPGR